ncbi:hypothetical protein [Deinococcus yavapaiensis]|uniref:Uncharacterized protein n=1 Tax=Deinococcus yavapaiensis KR-236 TaxID=694435 RepID=A0A318SBZ7_9DEIO|nr:hypothetical protein [Deinococcus yavapaiensis]PYE54398.1 hypothetical protein DES52_10535 [Deinococcus yavapaiensis KR-236]
MDDTKLSGIPPLGKSVEEVEDGGGNQVNPSTPGEALRDRGPLPPIPNTGATNAPALGSAESGRTDDRDR